jgi:hypothetical protein
MPIADVGPVADTIRPILICAIAAVEKQSAMTKVRRGSTKIPRLPEKKASLSGSASDTRRYSSSSG